MLREEVFGWWKNLKEKITMVRTPQWQQWEKTVQTINDKCKELSKAEGEEKKNQIREEISHLNSKIKDLETNLPPLSQAAVVNKRLNYLFSLETSLESRSLENKQYEDRLRQEEEKRNKLRGKLDKVRELLSEGRIEALKSLYKRGEI